MALTEADQLQLIRDVSEIKGMLVAQLSAHDERIKAVEADQDESRRVHASHDASLAELTARLAVVENTANSNRIRLEKAGDQTRATAALVVSIIVGASAAGGFVLNLVTP